MRVAAGAVDPLEVAEVGEIIVVVIAAFAELPAGAGRQPHPRFPVGKDLAGIFVGDVGIGAGPVVALEQIRSAEVHAVYWTPVQLRSPVLLGVCRRDAVHRRVRGGAARVARGSRVGQHPIRKKQLGRIVLVIVVAIHQLRFQLGCDLRRQDVVAQQRIDGAVQALRRKRRQAGRILAVNEERQPGVIREWQELLVLPHHVVGDRAHVAAFHRQVRAERRVEAIGLVVGPQRHLGGVSAGASAIDGAGGSRAERIFRRV